MLDDTRYKGNQNDSGGGTTSKDVENGDRDPLYLLDRHGGTDYRLKKQQLASSAEAMRVTKEAQVAIKGAAESRKKYYDWLKWAVPVGLTIIAILAAIYVGIYAARSDKQVEAQVATKESVKSLEGAFSDFKEDVKDDRKEVKDSIKDGFRQMNDSLGKLDRRLEVIERKEK